MTETIPHYYLDLCNVNISGYVPKNKEKLCFLLTKWNDEDLFGFIWSIRQGRDIIIPYVYPRKYSIKLKSPSAFSLLLTSARIIDLQGIGEFSLWKPTIVILPEMFWRE